LWGFFVRERREQDKGEEKGEEEQGEEEQGEEEQGEEEQGEEEKRDEEGGGKRRKENMKEEEIHLKICKIFDNKSASNLIDDSLFVFFVR
jgi:hypothetical protein